MNNFESIKFYETRNKLIVEEINSQIKNGNLIFSSADLKTNNSTTRVSSYATYYSSNLEKSIFIGIQESTRSNPLINVSLELEIRNKLSILHPEYLEELPLFIAVATFGTAKKDQEGILNKSFGVLTEDYSQMGNRDVKIINKKENQKLPNNISDLIKNPVSHIGQSNIDYLLRKICVDVEGERKLGKLSILNNGLNPKDLLDEFKGTTRILSQISKHTIFIPLRYQKKEE